MSKYFFSILISIMLLTGLTSAQFKNVEKSGGLARIMAMGESPYLIDPYVMTYNPAWSAVYSNFVWGDLGGENNVADDGFGQFIGANLNVVPDLTLGIILSRNDFPVSNIGVQIAGIDPTGMLNNYINNNANLIGLNNNVEVMGALSLANNLQLGLGASYASSGRDISPAGAGTSKYSAHQLGLNAGLLASFGGLGLDAGVSLLLPGASIQPSVGPERTFSQTIVSLTGRVFIPVSARFQFVPIASFTTATGTLDDGTISTDIPSLTQIALGAGINYTIENFLFTGGIALERTSSTQSSTQFNPEITNSRTTFPAWNLGAEWSFTNWLTGRIGYVSSRGSITNQNPASLTTIDEESFTFYGTSSYTLGLGFKFSKFTLSATVNERVLREGLNNIGGGTPTFAYLSATVAF